MEEYEVRGREGRGQQAGGKREGFLVRVRAERSPESPDE
jgi:hypothetical protein